MGRPSGRPFAARRAMEPKQLNLFEWARQQAADGKPPARPPAGLTTGENAKRVSHLPEIRPLDEATLQLELAAARQELRNWTVIGLRPGHSPSKLEHIRQAAQSCRAEVRLRFSTLEMFR